MSSEGASGRRVVLVGLSSILVLAMGFGMLVDYVDRATIFVGVGIVARIFDLVVLTSVVWSAAVTGARAMSTLGIDPGSRALRWVYAAMLGFTAQYMVGVLLATAQLVTRPVLWVAVLLPILMLRRENVELVRTLRETQWHLSVSPLVVVSTALALVYFVMTLSPPTWIDPLTYHLVIPRDYLAHGGVPGTFDNAFHSFPPAMSMLYMYLMGLGSDQLPKLLHGLFLVLLLILCHDRMRALSNRETATLAVLLFAGQWSVQHAIQRANVDFHFALYGVATFFVLSERFVEDRSGAGRGRWILAGIFLGTAIASKLHSVCVLSGCWAVFVSLLVRRRISFSDLVIFHAAAFAVYAPTLLRNLLYGAEPAAMLFPNSLAPALGIDAQEIARFAAISKWKRLFMTEVTAETFFLTPLFVYLDGAFPSTNFDAFIDPFYLLAIPLGVPFLLKGDRALRVTWAFIVGYYIVWLATAGLTRYGFPALPLLSFVTVHTLHRFAAWNAARYERLMRRGVRLLVVGFVVVSGLGMALEARVFLGNNVAAFFGVMDRGRFQMQSGTGAIDTMALSHYLAELEGSERGMERGAVFMIFDSQGYYLDRRYYNDPFYANVVLLRDAAEEGKDPLGWLRERGYRYVVFDQHREPWMRNLSRTNEALNPYPDALRRLEEMLAFWHQELEPRLVYQRDFRRLKLYTVPP